MKGMVWAGAYAGLLALAPLSVVADEAVETAAGSQDSADHQVNQIDGLTEIEELAVVRLRRADSEAEPESDDPAGMSEEDLLTGGFGERRVLTAEDDDDDGPVAGEAGLAEDQPVTHGPDAERSEGTQVEAEPLHEAIERNATLSDALRDRGVNVIQVVGIEIRGGTSVIVYIDETRG